MAASSRHRAGATSLAAPSTITAPHLWPRRPPSRRRIPVRLAPSRVCLTKLWHRDVTLVNHSLAATHYLAAWRHLLVSISCHARMSHHPTDKMKAPPSMMPRAFMASDDCSRSTWRLSGLDDLPRTLDTHRPTSAERSSQALPRYVHTDQT